MNEPAVYRDCESCGRRYAYHPAAYPVHLCMNCFEGDMFYRYLTAFEKILRKKYEFLKLAMSLDGVRAAADAALTNRNYNHVRWRRLSSE